MASQPAVLEPSIACNYCWVVYNYNMKKPTCIRNNRPVCELHKNGKFIKWTCDEQGYDPQKRHKIFMKKKVKCPDCDKLIANTSERCAKCYFKKYPSPLLGKKLPKWWCKKISDGQGKQEESVNWKGDNVGYWTKHKWMVKINGNPLSCFDCGIAGKKNKGGKWSIQWANISGNYERKKEDYKGLCVKCHCVFDGVTKSIDDYKHGEIGRYNLGCRCELCKKGKIVNRKLYEKKSQKILE